MRKIVFIYLASYVVMTTWDKLQSSKSREPQQDKAVRKPVEHFFKLVIGMGGPSPL